MLLSILVLTHCTRILSAQAFTQVPAPPVYQILISTQCQICGPPSDVVQYEGRDKGSVFTKQLGMGIRPFAVRVCAREAF